ncbi:hypothetical protein Sjap_018333 [Stephania japonica]|uniref:Uncharacterized protein n=1 Tax=Stephania japonica TaxID=461633 RepID=A0AAP0NKE9_9MAGN
MSERRTEIGRRKKRRSREELKSSGVRWRLRGRVDRGSRHDDCRPCRSVMRWTEKSRKKEMSERRTEIGRRKKRRSREELKSSGVRWRLRGRGGVSSAMAKAMAESGEGKGVVSLAGNEPMWKGLRTPESRTSPVKHRKLGTVLNEHAILVKCDSVIEGPREGKERSLVNIIDSCGTCLLT